MSARMTTREQHERDLRSKKKSGRQKLLFPAMRSGSTGARAHRPAELKDVDIYKVGHHGSLNATPKTLWNTFAQRSDKKDKPGRLVTVMSTRSDSKHGHVENDTEVPRRTLVTELKENSLHRSTQELEEPPWCSLWNSPVVIRLYGHEHRP